MLQSMATGWEMAAAAWAIAHPVNMLAETLRPPLPPHPAQTPSIEDDHSDRRPDSAPPEMGAGAAPDRSVR